MYFFEALARSIKEGMDAQAKHRNKRVAGSYDYESSFILLNPGNAWLVERVRRKRAPTDVEGAGTFIDPAVTGCTETAEGTPLKSSPLSSPTPRSPSSRESAAADAESAVSPWPSEVEMILKPVVKLCDNADIENIVKQPRFLKTTQMATGTHFVIFWAKPKTVLQSSTCASIFGSA